MSGLSSVWELSHHLEYCCNDKLSELDDYAEHAGNDTVRQ